MSASTKHRWGDKSRHERGYGQAWVKLRNTIIARDHGLCQPCKREGRITIANAVDHIKPKAQGGTDDPTNLEAICVDHHREKSLREAVAARGGKVKPRTMFTQDGRPIWPEE